mgnify:FL=1
MTIFTKRYIAKFKAKSSIPTQNRFMLYSNKFIEITMFLKLYDFPFLAKGINFESTLCEYERESVTLVIKSSTLSQNMKPLAKNTQTIVPYHRSTSIKMQECYTLEQDNKSDDP